MSTRQPLLTNAALLAVSNVGSAALSFVLTILLGRAFGENGLGTYAVALAWVTPLSLLADFGISTLITREVAADVRQQAALVPAAVRARLVLGGALTLLLAAAAPVLSRDAGVVAGIQWSAPLILIQPLFSTYSAAFRARGAMWPLPWLNIGMLAVQLWLTALVIDLHPADVLPALVINMLTSLGQLGVCWGLYRVYFWQREGDGREKAADLLRRSRHFAGAGVLAAIQLRMSPALLEVLSDIHAAGLYSGANRLVEGARLLPVALYGALFPTLGAFAQNRARMRATFLRALAGMLAYGLLCVCGFALAGPLLLGLFGRTFATAAGVLNILAIAFAASILRGTVTLYRYAQGREAAVNRINFGVTLAQLALSVALIPPLGALGAAWAVVAAECTALAALAALRPPLD